MTAKNKKRLWALLVATAGLQHRSDFHKGLMYGVYACYDLFKPGSPKPKTPKDDRDLLLMTTLRCIVEMEKGGFVKVELHEEAQQRVNLLYRVVKSSEELREQLQTQDNTGS